jgi:hypothetical protein
LLDILDVNISISQNFLVEDFLFVNPQIKKENIYIHLKILQMALEFRMSIGKTHAMSFGSKYVDDISHAMP